MSRHQEHTQKKTTEAAAPAETRSGEAYYHALARTYVAEPYDPGSLRPLRRRVRRDLRTLRRNYEEALTSHRRAAPGSLQEWLADNYHLLSREGEGVLEDLKYAGPQPCDDGCPALYRLCLRLAREKGVPQEAEWDTLLETAQQHRPLTVPELDQLSLCLRAALISLATEACSQKGEEAVRSLSRAVKGLRTAADTDFARLAERHSIVERILAEDPSGIYPRMDESSRADYRRRVGELAMDTEKSEASVAADLVERQPKLPLPLPPPAI